MLCDAPLSLPRMSLENQDFENDCARASVEYTKEVAEAEQSFKAFSPTSLAAPSSTALNSNDSETASTVPSGSQAVVASERHRKVEELLFRRVHMLEELLVKACQELGRVFPDKEERHVDVSPQESAKEGQKLLKEVCEALSTTRKAQGGASTGAVQGASRSREHYQLSSEAEAFLRDGQNPAHVFRPMQSTLAGDSNAVEHCDTLTGLPSTPASLPSAFPHPIIVLDITSMFSHLPAKTPPAKKIPTLSAETNQERREASQNPTGSAGPFSSGQPCRDAARKVAAQECVVQGASAPLPSEHSSTVAAAGTTRCDVYVQTESLSEESPNSGATPVRISGSPLKGAEGSKKSPLNTIEARKLLDDQADVCLQLDALKQQIHEASRMAAQQERTIHLLQQENSLLKHRERKGLLHDDAATRSSSTANTSSLSHVSLMKIDSSLQTIPFNNSCKETAALKKEDSSVDEKQRAKLFELLMDERRRRQQELEAQESQSIFDKEEELRHLRILMRFSVLKKDSDELESTKEKLRVLWHEHSEAQRECMVHQVKCSEAKESLRTIGEAVLTALDGSSSEAHRELIKTVKKCCQVMGISINTRKNAGKGAEKIGSTKPPKPRIKGSIDPGPPSDSLSFRRWDNSEEAAECGFSGAKDSKKGIKEDDWSLFEDAPPSRSSIQRAMEDARALAAVLEKRNGGKKNSEMKPQEDSVTCVKGNMFVKHVGSAGSGRQSGRGSTFQRSRSNSCVNDFVNGNLSSEHRAASRSGSRLRQQRPSSAYYVMN